MKVLLINNGYPSSPNSNNCTYIKSIADCLRCSGFSVEILTSAEFSSKWQKFFSYFGFFCRILFFRRYHHFDLVYCNHFHFYFFLLRLRKSNIRHLVIHYHGSEVRMDSLVKKWLSKISFKLLPTNNITHIAPSKFFSGKVAKLLKVSPDEILVSPSGGVSPIFCQEIADPSRSAKDSINIGFASGLTFSKGADFVCRLSHDVEYCSINGRGLRIFYIDYGQDKEEYIREMSQQSCVRFPPMSKSEMVNFYNVIDILIVPTRGESLGLVALESLFCQKPVLAPNDFSFPEFILPGINGELYEPGNYEDFKNKLLEMIDKGYDDQGIRANYSSSSVSEFYANKLMGLKYE